jgi:hypothetical protein
VVAAEVALSVAVRSTPPPAAAAVAAHVTPLSCDDPTRLGYAKLVAVSMPVPCVTSVTLGSLDDAEASAERRDFFVSLAGYSAQPSTERRTLG